VERWAIYIDVEGFSNMFRRDRALARQALMTLTEGVRRVFNQFPTCEHERVFAHAFGDGYLILSDFPEVPIDRAIAVATGLQQFLLTRGFVGRAGVSCGDFMDIQEDLNAALATADARHEGDPPAGVMTVGTVMGDALINAYKVQEDTISGPMLFLEPSLRDHITDDAMCFLQDRRRSVVIDWLRSTCPHLDRVRVILDLDVFGGARLFDQLRRYLGENKKLSREWRHNTEVLISGNPSGLSLARK